MHARVLQGPELILLLLGCFSWCARVQEDVCFVSSAGTMRRVFTLPFAAGPVSLVLHRVGDMLVMEGMLELCQTPAAQPHQSNRARGDRQVEENFLYFSTQASDDLTGSDPAAEGHLHVDLHEAGDDAARTFPGRLSPGKRRGRHASATTDRSSTGSTTSGTSTSSTSTSTSSRSSGGHSSSAFTSASTTSTAAANEEDVPQFRRSFHCEVGKYQMLLGSDLIVFSNERRESKNPPARTFRHGRFVGSIYPEFSTCGGADPAFSMQLVNVDREVPSMACLELWLENVFQSIPETGICCHKDGFVQGYKLMRTQELPSLDTGRTFQPAAVMQGGTTILKFLHGKTPTTLIGAACGLGAL